MTKKQLSVRTQVLIIVAICAGLLFAFLIVPPTLILLFYDDFDFSDFPSATEIDESIALIEAAESSQARKELTESLLWSLQSPNSVADIVLIQHALETLAKIYLRTHDEGILAAVDERPADAGLTNLVCGFYTSLRDDTVFRERYENDPVARAALYPCEGILFRPEEPEDIILVP